MTYGDLNTALKAAGYAKKAYDAAKLGYNVYNAYNAAQSGASGASAAAAGAGITPALGLGAVGGLYALFSTLGSQLQSAQIKNAQRSAQGQQRQMEDAGRVMQYVMQGPQQGTTLRQWLEGQPWQGQRLGDLLYTMAARNLSGDYIGDVQSTKGPSARSGPFSWVPNPNFAPLAAGLKAMGFTNQATDPIGLISRSGGWLPQRNALSGTPVGMDTQRGADTWDKLLSGISKTFQGRVPQQLVSQVPQLSKSETVERYGGHQYGAAGPELQQSYLVKQVAAGAPLAKEFAEQRGISLQEPVPNFYDRYMESISRGEGWNPQDYLQLLQREQEIVQDPMQGYGSYIESGGGP